MGLLLSAKTPGWHRYTWTTIVLYQFEGTESGKWELTYYQTKRARAPEGPVAEPALPNDCLY